MTATSRILAICLLLPAAAALAQMDLPEWEGRPDDRGYVLGGGLWPAAGAAGRAQPGLPSPLPGGAAGGATGSPGELPPVVAAAGRAEDLVAVPRLGGDVPGMRPVMGLRVPAPMLLPLRLEEEFVHELPPVDGELRDEYFSLRPVEYLVDPQRLLTEQKSHDIQRFLEYHADEADYDICLLLFGASQEIPADLSLAERHAQWFGKEPVVTVAYFLDHPERAQLVYGQHVRERLPPVVFERILQSCVREAQVAATAYDQVERFSIELSIRLYWMAKLLERQSAGETIAATHHELTEPDWQEMGAGAGLGGPDFAAGSRAAAAGLGLTALPWIWLGSAGVFSGALLGMGWWWWRRDSLAAKPVLFPDLQLPGRLGGAYSGGAHVGISFDVSGHGNS